MPLNVPLIPSVPPCSSQWSGQGGAWILACVRMLPVGLAWCLGYEMYSPFTLSPFPCLQRGLTPAKTPRCPVLCVLLPLPGWLSWTVCLLLPLAGFPRWPAHPNPPPCWLTQECQRPWGRGTGNLQALFPLRSQRRCPSSHGPGFESL